MRARSLRHPRSDQRGAALLLLVVTLVLGGAAVFYGLSKPAGSSNAEKDKRTTATLAQARQALIEYASARPIANRPGELPCPDRTNDGTAEGNCNTPANRVGRFPWSTLGAPDLRDGSGERLWYAVSNNFKNNTAVTPLNSNTLGQLTVTGIAPQNNVIAIVFSVGTVVAGQNRLAANVNNVTHYLEGENATTADTIFTTAAPSGTFNDRLLAITSAMFFPQVEMRVAREARDFLNAYFNNPAVSPYRYFPFAHAYGGAGLCAASGQGRIPTNPVNCAGQQTWPSVLPPWFAANNWEQVLFYAVAPACTNPATPNCTGAGGFLTVNGVGGVRALLIAPGTPYTGQARPCTTITNCLEPPNTTSFPVFTHDSISATTNDRVVIVAP